MARTRSWSPWHPGVLMLITACGGGSEKADGGVMATTPAPFDGGIPCGLYGGCAPPEECCLADPMAPKCVPQGGCHGSSLSCSTAKQCSRGQVCCFSYSRGGAGGGTPTAMPFSAQCSLVCSPGDSIHYQLCATASECLGGGESCVQGPEARYCTGPTNPSPFPDFTDSGSD